MIVATAGHVDHGKTELIRALTGVDTDRLPEEKARGLSIDLGFAYQTLADDRVIGFVDVPGHEKFIRNMLAGVGGIDLGLLVVAADDGVMPQTREHTAILDLLGIDNCLVALTKIDTVSDSRVLEVREQVDALLAATRFAGAAVYPVCAPDSVGVETLHSAVRSRLAAQAERSTRGHFRLAVDRCFSLKGIGLVVTGIVVAGEVTVEDQLLLSPAGLPVRVRGIRAHDQLTDSARAGDRCALNIVGRGVSEASVSRGDWVVHESLHEPTDRIDVELRVLASEQRSMKHWTPVHIHHGARHLTGRVAVLQGGVIEPGSSARAQLVLDDATAVHWGDRLVIRDQSARRTVAGGTVTDPYSPKRGRARPERLAWLEAMSLPDPADALQALCLAAPVGVELLRFARARNLTYAELEELVPGLAVVRTGRGESERVIAESVWQHAQQAVLEFVSRHHQQHSDLLGPNPKEVRFGIGIRLSEDVVEHLVRDLIAAGRLQRRGQSVHLPDHTVHLLPPDQALWRRVEPELTMATGSPPSLPQLAQTLGVDKPLLESFMKRALQGGWVVQIARHRYIGLDTLDQLTGVLENLASEHPDGFTAAEYRDASGLGRNFVIDLLEYFDRIGVSDRVGNYRRLRRSRTTQ